MGLLDDVAGGFGITSALGGGLNDITGVTGQNDANTAAAAQQQAYTQQNMATSFADAQTAYQTQLQDQTQLADTAIQRQQADMKAAGINPILAANTGGSPTPNVSMSSPGAPGGASANQGMKGSSLLDAASDISGQLNSAKSRQQADENIKNIGVDTENKGVQAQINEATKDTKIDAINSQNQEEESAADLNTTYNQMDAQNPTTNYLIHKLNGGGASSAKSLMGTVQSLGEMF